MPNINELKKKFAALEKDQRAKQGGGDSKQAAKKKRLQTEEARYTLVLHSARKRLGLTINEYCLADTIHKLSGNKSIVPGWCYASKDHLGNSLGFSRRTAHNLIDSLKNKKVVVSDPDTSYLATTELWYSTVEITKSKVFSSD